MAASNRERRNALNKAFPPNQIRAIVQAITKQSIAVARSAATATSNAVLAAHTELVLPDLEGGKTYLITGLLPLSIGAAANNIKVDFNGGTAVASTVAGVCTLTLANGTNAVTAVTALNTSVDGATTNAWIACRVELLVTLSSGGSIALQYAQSVSGATNSTISAGAALRAVEVG